MNILLVASAVPELKWSSQIQGSQRRPTSPGSVSQNAGPKPARHECLSEGGKGRGKRTNTFWRVAAHLTAPLFNPQTYPGHSVGGEAAWWSVQISRRSQRLQEGVEREGHVMGQRHAWGGSSKAHVSDSSADKKMCRSNEGEREPGKGAGPHRCPPSPPPTQASGPCDSYFLSSP